MPEGPGAATESPTESGWTELACWARQMRAQKKTNTINKVSFFILQGQSRLERGMGAKIFCELL